MRAAPTQSLVASLDDQKSVAESLAVVDPLAETIDAGTVLQKPFYLQILSAVASAMLYF